MCIQAAAMQRRVRIFIYSKVIKSFCLRDRGRLGNEGQPILLKIGTQRRYMPTSVYSLLAMIDFSFVLV